jgi:enoyl-[acyl-carrier protein] reductase II
VIRNEYTAYFDAHPEELQRFPEQMGRSFQDGALHLGGDQDLNDIDPNRECYPAGQGVGGIHELVPAGELVRRFVAQADAVLDRLPAYRSAPPTILR